MQADIFIIYSLIRLIRSNNIGTNENPLVSRKKLTYKV